MYVKTIEGDMMRPEYGVLVCRLLEHLPAGLTPPFGISVVEVEPGGAVNLHGHHEHEMWVLIAGTGVFQVHEDEQEVSGSMVFYMAPHSQHSIRNTQSDQSLKFLSVWWD